MRVLGVFNHPTEAASAEPPSNRKWVSFGKVEMVSQETRQKWLRCIETRFERLGS